MKLLAVALAGVPTIDIVTGTYVDPQRVALSLQQPVDYWINGFAWDLAGRLSSVSSPAGTFTYMRVIQERDGSNWPQVSYTRGTDLSGSFEGAGGIGGLLARSHDFTNCNATLTYWLTNDSGYCIYDLALWDDYGTYVDGVYVGPDPGDGPWQYSFTGVPGRTYYVWGNSCDYYNIQVFSDSFTGTLDTHAVDFDSGGGVTDTESGIPLCDGGSSGRWLTHNYYHADANGNITCLVDANQSVVASYRYDPYGNTLAQSGALANANTYRFSSKEFHAGSGLYYYGYRFYDPSLQRWINRDPIMEQGFEAVRHALPIQFSRLLQRGERLEGPNLYEFLGNSPENRYDALGLAMGPPVPPRGVPKCFNGTPCSLSACQRFCTDMWKSTLLGCLLGGPFAPGCEITGTIAWASCDTACELGCHAP